MPKDHGYKIRAKRLAPKDHGYKNRANRLVPKDHGYKIRDKRLVPKDHGYKIAQLHSSEFDGRATSLIKLYSHWSFKQRASPPH